MRNPVMCWAPECGELVPQPARGYRRYCNANCKMKAFRRNGKKAPSVPYPPLLPTLVPAPSVVAPPENSAPPVSWPTPVPHADGPTAGGTELDAAAHAETTAVSSTTRRSGQLGAQGSSGPAVPVAEARPAPAPAPAEPVIKLSEHLAKMAEVANPPAPEPPPEHPLVAKYRSDLEALGQASSRDGLQVLQLAEKLVSSATSPAASAGLSRELKGLMEGLEQNSPEAMAERDPSLFIRERTLAKLKALAVAHDNVA
jgi:hypothetical protein